MMIDGIDIETLPQAFAYNSDGSINYVQIVTPGIPGSYSGGTYRQTMTYTSGNLTGVSAWVKQ